MQKLWWTFVMMTCVACATNQPTENADGRGAERGPAGVSDLCARLHQGGFFLPGTDFPYYAKKSRFPRTQVIGMSKASAGRCAYLEVYVKADGVILDDKPLKSETFSFAVDVLATNRAFEALKSRDMIDLTLVSGAGVIVNSAAE